MKKLISLLLLSIVVFTAFSACTPRQVDEKGKITVVIDQETPLVYSVSLEDIDLSEGALSVLKYLQTNEGLKLEYEDSSYGAYLTALGDIQTDANGFLSVFTSVESEWDVTEYCVTKEYGGTTIKTASKGISSLSVIDGMILYFCYIAY